MGWKNILTKISSLIENKNLNSSCDFTEMAKGIRINNNKNTLKRNVRKYSKVKRLEKKTKRLAKKSKIAEPTQLDPLTTKHIAKKRLTNPKANITISGKKWKLLIKQIKGEKRAAIKKEQQISQAITSSKAVETMDVN